MQKISNIKNIKVVLLFIAAISLLVLIDAYYFSDKEISSFNAVDRVKLIAPSGAEMELVVPHCTTLATPNFGDSTSYIRLDGQWGYEADQIKLNCGETESLAFSVIRGISDAENKISPLVFSATPHRKIGNHKDYTVYRYGRPIDAGELIYYLSEEGSVVTISYILAAPLTNYGTTRLNKDFQVSYISHKNLTDHQKMIDKSKKIIEYAQSLIVSYKKSNQPTQ